MIGAAGQWTPDNCRKRLRTVFKNLFSILRIFDTKFRVREIFRGILESKKSMFCNYEKISCEILNTAIGPDHAKIAIAELKLTLRKYGKGIIGKLSTIRKMFF